ncbi:MAG: hypothetical protein NWF07_03870 [Candidatus Bathyarchaeota archaeon]|nr:hypothetical protein [Candidatus Bathyarchaeota archaeon]
MITTGEKKPEPAIVNIPGPNTGGLSTEMLFPNPDGITHSTTVGIDKATKIGSNLLEALSEKTT